MTDIRKEELLESMCEYIAEFIGDDDEEEMPADWIDAVWYIKELVGMSDVLDVLCDTIGLTDEEIIEAGFEIEIEEE